MKPQLMKTLQIKNLQKSKQILHLLNRKIKMVNLRISPLINRKMRILPKKAMAIFQKVTKQTQMKIFQTILIVLTMIPKKMLN